MLPGPEEIQRHYEGYFHTHRPAELSEATVRRMHVEARQALRHDWQFHALSSALGGLNGKRILDVGCGLGPYLLRAHLAGAEVVGCDVSPEACDFVRHKLKLPIQQGTLEQSLSAIGSVDGVVMRDFIEHPREPLRDLRAAAQVLNAGGALLLHTPNGGQAGRELATAKSWVGFRVDLEHLQYLAPRTIDWLARTCDLSIERLEVFGYPFLQGVESLPRVPTRFWQVARQRFRSHEGLRRLLNAMRAFRAEITGAVRDMHFGAYHLMAVLRKSNPGEEPDRRLDVLN
jgi:2-polyprenyl-3-methyl-5-hydroxy-6-metoxy-1,4-benzoquinol methylase